jgi:hypothetical protein
VYFLASFAAFAAFAVKTFSSGAPDSLSRSLSVIAVRNRHRVAGWICQDGLIPNGASSFFVIDSLDEIALQWAISVYSGKNDFFTTEATEDTEKRNLTADERG